MDRPTPDGFGAAGNLPTNETPTFAGSRPSFGVEEVPEENFQSPVVSEAPPPIEMGSSPVQNSSEPQTVVETIPLIPHVEVDSPPAPEHLDLHAQTLSTPTPSPAPTGESLAPVEAPSAITNLPPSDHNVIGKSNPLRKFLFLIPAVLLVATIYFVAKFTGRDFTMRAPAPIATPLPISAPEESPMPTPIAKKTKSYKNEDMLIEMMVPEEYQVLSEDSESVSFGKDDTEVLIVRMDEFTNYDDEDQTIEVVVGGKEAVEFTLEDEGSVPVRIVQTLDEPRYEFVMFLENSVLSVDFQEILDSVVFLVDTSNWETFENSTFSYAIKYPPTWDENTPSSDGKLGNKTEISKNAQDKSLNTLVIQTSSNLDNAALTASEIVSSTRTLSGWTNPPRIELKKLGGGDAQVIQGELSGKWRAYVVIWYKNSVVQMTWDDASTRPEQQVFESMLSSFEFTT